MKSQIIRRVLVLGVVASTGAAVMAAPAARAPQKHVAATSTTPPTSRPTSRPTSKSNLPTQDAIKAAFEAGEYQKVVQLVTRAVSAKAGSSAAAAAAAAAADYDRYELLTMRGEAYLHLKQNKSAGDSFGMAAKETKDDQKAATARAMQRTVREARGSTVQRRAKSAGAQAAAAPATPATADLLKPDEREAAFRIVYDNLRDAAASKVKAASDARTLPPIVEALSALADLDDLAQAGAGGDNALAASRQELGDRGRELIARELDRMEKDVAEIKKSAETVVEQRSIAVQSLSTGQGYDKYLSIRRGLTDKDRTDLKDVMKTCERIVPAAEQLARSVSGTAKNADELVNRSKAVGREAQRVLEAKYEGQQQKVTKR
jgi:hypothetical protein